ncbi:MAG: hypothetical protein H7A51_10840 [Akkermansiaceae bacterium]|nr:hypothetical protein [Akkermansiaceae bacterium]
MRKIGSYLIILVFLTAYGRCVADQFGMLHNSEASCCVTLCDVAAHCPTAGEDHPADTGHPDSEAPDDREQPAPCQLCFILGSDSMLLEDGLQLPSPTLLELSDFFSFTATLDDILRAHGTSLTRELTPSGYPDPSAEHRSRLMRIGAKTTPVRGPSLA